MMLPLMAAFSASCSAKATLAPRPATSAGSSPARVTTGTAATVPDAPATPANAVPLLATMDRPTPAAVADATATAAHRLRPLDHRATALVMLGDMDDSL